MGQVKMLGALVGDIIGSVYEFCNTKSTDFQLFYGRSRFTGDSVMALAVAKWLLRDEEVFIWNDSCGGHHADGDELFNEGEEGKYMETL